MGHSAFLLMVALLLLLCSAAEDEYNELDCGNIPITRPPSDASEQSFCQLVYKCLGIERRYETPTGATVYEYGPQVRYKSVSPPGVPTDDGIYIHLMSNIPEEADK